MKLRVLVLGAGFGGLELSSILSQAMGGDLDLTLIDRNDSFYFGASKLDVMFGRKTPEAVLLPYRNIKKIGVRFCQETILAIDPETRRVTTDKGSYHADVLVIALGADYDLGYTPGLAKGGNEFYSFEGAQRLREVLPTFTRGHAVIGVVAEPFKCPPAPSEAALLLHDYLTQRGVRKACTITLVMPFPTPVPPSEETSLAIMKTFKDQDIQFIGRRTIQALDTQRHVLLLDDDTELPCDLLLGVPKHCVPEVVARSGMTENGWIPVDPKTLQTRFPNVYAIGDVTSVGTPKAGDFAEGAARTVAEEILSEFRHTQAPPPYRGLGTCYIEFGSERVARIDVEFLAGQPTGKFTVASMELVNEKLNSNAARRKRWFNME